MLSVFSSPSRYTQGKNATAELGKEMKALGLEGPALIIAGRSALKLLSETWKQSLGAAGIKHNVHPFGGECSLAEIERGKAEAKKQGARVIVGAGGGKLLDAARAVAAAWTCPSSIARRWLPAMRRAAPCRSFTPTKASSSNIASIARTPSWCWSTRR
jgi:Glycerol dehydrogenase and related enzymes